MKQTFPSADAMRPGRMLSAWDLVVIPLILVGLYLLTIAFEGAAVPFTADTPDLTVSLDPANLPYYGLRSLLRMFVAVVFSVAFTLTYAPLAAKSHRAERVLIPILDFLQSLPILGFLTATTTIFLGLFRGSVLGLEAASVFAIFTSQVWNMTFSFYHSLLTTPKELKEAAGVLQLSAWQRFWKLEVPYAMPGLVWNTMMSVSGGWFFVVASEVISVMGRERGQALPGIGAYISLAIAQANLSAMAYAAVALLALVLLYDQLCFRPIVAWAEKFKFEQSEAQETAESWMLTLWQRARFVRNMAGWLRSLSASVSLAASRGARPGTFVEPTDAVRRPARSALDRMWNVALAVVCLALVYVLVVFMLGPGLGFAGGRPLAPNSNLNLRLDPALAARFREAGVPVGDDQTVFLSRMCAASGNGMTPSPALAALLGSDGVPAPTSLAVACARPLAPAGKVALAEIREVLWLGVLTALRVVAMIVLALVIWTPIGVWIGLRPRVAQIVQPLLQFAAAFPANLVFPVAVVLITRFRLSPQVWLSPLMVLGTQWYIAFNVVAGTVGIPNDLKEAARVAGLSGWAWWRRLILPAIFPAFVTGGITASGGSWNASIVAEVVSWGSTTLTATGLGAYIAHWSTGAFNPHVALGMLTMGLFVLGFNRLLWRRLYALAEERYRLD